jgi:hypothetical protein
MNSACSSETRFRETQRFTQVWVWLAVAFVAGVGWWALVQQVLLGQPFGNRPAPDAAVIAIWVLCGIGLPVLLATCRLITEVRSDGLYVRYLPFHLRWKRFSLEDIATCEACTYRPLLEYGGWGIRWGPGGWAYNVKGNRGVQLELNTGKRLLVGSQRSNELAGAVKFHNDHRGGCN